MKKNREHPVIHGIFKIAVLHNICIHSESEVSAHFLN